MVHTDDKLAVALLNGAPDALICVDGAGRIVLVNAQAESMFGYAHGELAGRPVELLIPPAGRAVHSEHRARYMAEPGPRPMGTGRTLHAQRKDGSTFSAEISLAAVAADDGVLVMAAVRDITESLELQAQREQHTVRAERSRIERRLQQSQRLESLGELAGGVAHDFNNLLAVIANYAAFVQEEIAKVGTRQQADWRTVREDVEQIQQAAGRAAGLTRQLLAFARQDVVEPRTLDLNKVIAGIREMLIRTLDEHVILKTELAPELCPVLADPGQIEQVLVNLAINARDAMPGGGTLMVQTCVVDIDPARSAGRGGPPAGRYACMKISDTGTGMSQDVIDHAFEPFFTTKARGEGTGLGLATVYGIITQAGGHVQIYSELGLGTTFTILLPATSRVARPLPLPAQRSAGGTGETVVIVEDEPAMLEVTARLLSRNGYHVITTENAREAVQIVAGRTGGIDVLLTDVIMPHMLGREVADKIRAIQPSVKVLFMSGYTQGLLDTQGVLADGVHLIEKPFTEGSLLGKLRQVIDGGDAPA